MNLDRLNDRQKEAVLHKDGPLLVLAGAGSGKTSVLTSSCLLYTSDAADDLLTV